MPPSDELVLDWRIRLWVLLPIALATALVAILRHNILATMLRPPRLDLHKLRDAAALSRSARFRSSSHLLHPAQSAARRTVFASADGPLRRVAAAKTASPMTALMDPEMLGNQVISLLMQMVPSVVLGQWVRYLFGGFAVCRLPFPLGPQFRGMLQIGIERAGQSLDVRYVSALSWYIINLFGASGIVDLLLDGGEDDLGDVAGEAQSVSAASRLASLFQGFNDAREKERKILVSMKPVYSLVEREVNLLSRDPMTVCF